MSKILNAKTIRPRSKNQSIKAVEKFSNPKLFALFITITFLLFYASLAWGATISGKVEIEGRKDLSGVLITVQEKSLSGITKPDGTYSIQDVPPGSYTLIAQKIGCIVVVRSDVIVSGESSSPENFQMIPGDLNIDNQINLLDRVALTSAWEAKKGDPNWDSILDIYEDGIIDNNDKELLLAHWRKGDSGVKLGSLKVESVPSGAAIWINGADTGYTTPYFFRGLVTGTYTITLIRQNYPSRTEVATIKQEGTEPINITLDNQPPEFVDWQLDPPNLTEDTRGRLRISVQVIDTGGSGLSGKTPQFDFHIGANTNYSVYKDMTKGTGDVWFYDIPEPVETWNVQRGKFVYFKAKIVDVAGNESISDEQTELIDDINDPPVVKITSTYNVWESGLVRIDADASDSDGNVTGVKFEYSTDNAIWTQIGSLDTTSPYSAAWDTTTAIRGVVSRVWIRVTAYDNNNASAEDSLKTTFGIDNQPPVTTNDYDKLWHNTDFAINLKANDGDGIGVSKVAYRLNSGIKQESQEGQANIAVNITTEGAGNILEYWSTDKLGNEEQQKTLTSIKLDKTPPNFSDWKQDPENLTEDSKGRFRVSAQMADTGGSGFDGKIPQIDYRIGREGRYDGYENMVTEDGKTWSFNIPEPIETWDTYRGQYVYYKATIQDVAGNVAESLERSELIEDINDPPRVVIISRFNPWMKGNITIAAEASDTDGTIAGVQFEYSLDNITWIPIGPIIIKSPFSVDWDTTVSLTKATKVWIQATATDDGNAKASYAYPVSIGIDNQPPTTKAEYDDRWHIMDFSIILIADDGEGIGVSLDNIKYKINDGDEKSLARDGQPWITKEGLNQLEYWSIDDLENVEPHRKLTNLKLDKTAPAFTDWTKDPKDLTEDSTVFFRVSVRVIDSGDSGLEGKVPRFSYRIGRDSQYTESKPMTKGEASDVWDFDIPQPPETWDGVRGKTIYYKATVDDIAGNAGVSAEQEELIDSINDPPVVKITTRFDQWMRGSIKIDAESSDSDGTIAGVRFEYSFNQVLWTPIGSLIALPPHSVQWDTKVAIPEVAQTVWVKAVATDNDGATVESKITTSFSVDNQPPIVSQDYDNLWHNKDFAINLRASDRNGIGVDKVAYRINYGEANEVAARDQVSVPVNITTEGAENVLEYWSIDKLGNESTHETLLNIKLDKTAPTFSDWRQDPPNLTEDTTGRFRISVQVTDTGGSGIAGKVPQIDYRIGTDKQYDGYENMIGENGRIWRFDILEPIETWDIYKGKELYYKTRIEDIAGNVAESPEQKELIESINDQPLLKLTSKFGDWEGGKITVTAEASDPDGSSPNLQFYYSIDLKNWSLIGVTLANPPEYSVLWDTKVNIPEIEKTVWVKASATDADDNTVLVENIVPKSFGIDNQPPTFGSWTKSPQNLTEDTRGSLRVQVEANDGQGSGVAKAELAYRIGNRTQSGFSDMNQGVGNLWFFDIPEPMDTWDKYRGEKLFFRARAFDVVGNQSPETPEQEELIDSINDPPRAIILSTYKQWERGTISIQAEATDDDGQIVSAQFQYSTDNANWLNIGAPLTRPAYITTWDTTVIETDPDVWVKIVVTDNENEVAEAVIARSFGIDNKAPAFKGWLHSNLTEDTREAFKVEVVLTETGSGVDSNKVEIKYHIGDNTSYLSYRTMIKKSGATDTWTYEIPTPAGDWSTYAGQSVYYIVRAADTAGNSAESQERSEFIEPTTGSISGIILPSASWSKSARVAALQNGIIIQQVLVSLNDGSYKIAKLKPGFYDLEVNALGYGTDRSMKNIEVRAGQDSPNHNVQLYTYVVADITNAQGGTAEYTDESLKVYKLSVESNTFEGKAVLGISGREPFAVNNPNVSLLGKSIGLGFQGKSISKPIRLIMPRPAGISDGKSIMTFIYNGTDYRFVERDNISTSDTTINITIAPEDVMGFSDQNHSFDKVLSRIADTVFYVIITKFEDPQVASTVIGIRPGNPIDSSNLSPKIALIIHDITTDYDDFSNMRVALGALSNYYDYILTFSYVAGNTIDSNSVFLGNELSKILPSGFAGKIDIIAHGMGGLIARRLITTGGDSRIGSLTMLGTPNGGVESGLLKLGFSEFLKKSQSKPAWAYYKDGWQNILADSAFISALNSQLRKQVNTHYYSIAAAGANDGLITADSADFTSNIRFPNLESPLTEKFETVLVPTAVEGPGFMSRTSHVAMVKSTEVLIKITNYILGSSRNLKYERYEGELVPGQTVSQFKVVLKNTGTTTIRDVVGKLSTLNIHIRKYNDLQGIEDDTDTFGDILPNSTKTGIFSFKVSPNATVDIGKQVTFTITTQNSSDNSFYKESFDVPIGGNLILIALDLNNEKQVVTNVAKDSFRPDNDGDPAVEPGEIMSLDITLKNNSASSVQSVTAILKTNDTRVTGLTASNQTPVNLATTGISVSYGTLAGNSTKKMTYQFVKINDDFTPLGDQVEFSLEIKSGTTFIGSDEFDVKVGADIVMTSFDVDSNLKPGGPQEYIDVEIKNITSSNINNVRVELDADDSDIDIIDYRRDLSVIRAGDTELISFLTQIDAGFSGYARFTLEIKVGGTLINTQLFRYYFGKRSYYLSSWVVEDYDNDKIPEARESIRLQAIRWNPTDEIVQDVEARIDTTDVAIINFDESEGDYGDIPANSYMELRSSRIYEFDIAEAGNITKAAPSGSTITSTILQVTGAKWIPDAFVGGTLNPNTNQASPQKIYTITGNTVDTITVQLGTNPPMTDVAANGDPFSIVSEDATYNQFELQGRTVQFTLDVEEDREPMGQEIFNMRIGGLIRYLPPTSFNSLLATLSDSTSISSNNNGNGRPEPGEIIEITVTMRNASDDIDVDDVVVELDTDERDVDIVNNYDVVDYGDIRSERDRAEKFRVEIFPEFEGNIIVFQLLIEGKVDNINRDLGIDEFIIPVYEK